MKTGIPVLMYHSVGVPNPKWIWSFLTVPYTIFEGQIQFLKRRGFNSIGLGDLYECLNSGNPQHKNSIVLTFDDGYLDNWVYVYPILKKYGFKGTIFVNPEFVDPSPHCRPTLEDVWEKRIGADKIDSFGFLSWAEMKKMEADGVMDIQSHAMTHTWYFSCPQIIDFRHPGDKYIWMDWNEAPDMKWQYLFEDRSNKKAYGMPVYEYGKSLEVRRFYPDPKLSKYLVDYVSSKGQSFFHNPDWRNVLTAETEDYKKKNKIREGYESNKEYLARLDWELSESKRIIETKLDKRVEFLCWPGGGYNQDAINISKKYYLATTLSSRDSGGRKNRFGEDYTRIKRIGVPYIEQGDKIIYPGGRYLYYFIKEYHGGWHNRFLRRMLKLFETIGLRTAYEHT